MCCLACSPATAPTAQVAHPLDKCPPERPTPPARPSVPRTFVPGLVVELRENTKQPLPARLAEPYINVVFRNPGDAAALVATSRSVAREDLGSDGNLRVTISPLPGSTFRTVGCSDRGFIAPHTRGSFYSLEPGAEISLPISLFCLGVARGHRYALSVRYDGSVYDPPETETTPRLFDSASSATYCISYEAGAGVRFVDCE